MGSHALALALTLLQDSTDQPSQAASTMLGGLGVGIIVFAVLFGLATLSYTRHPEGFLDYVGARTQDAIARRRAARSGAGGSRAPGATPGIGRPRPAPVGEGA